MKIFDLEISLSAFADVTSIIAFALTIYVSLSINEIKKKYMLKATVPDVLKNLGAFSSEFSSLLNDFKGNKDGIVNLLSRLDVQFESLEQKKPSKQVIDRTGIARRKIKSYQYDQKENVAREVYASLLAVIQSLDTFIKDSVWKS